MSLTFISRSPSTGPTLPREGPPTRGCLGLLPLPRSLRGLLCAVRCGVGFKGRSGSVGPPSPLPPQPGSQRLCPRSRQSPMGPVSGLPFSQACPWSTAVCRACSVHAWHVGARDSLPLPCLAGSGLWHVAQPRDAGRTGRARPCPEDVALWRVTDIPALCPGRGCETFPPRPLLQSAPPPGPVRTCSDALGGKAASELHIKCSCTETRPQSNYTRKQEEPFRLIWLF